MIKISFWKRSRHTRAFWEVDWMYDLASSTYCPWLPQDIAGSYQFLRICSWVFPVSLGFHWGIERFQVFVLSPSEIKWMLCLQCLFCFNIFVVLAFWHWFSQNKGWRGLGVCTSAVSMYLLHLCVCVWVHLHLSVSPKVSVKVYMDLRGQTENLAS